MPVGTEVRKRSSLLDGRPFRLEDLGEVLTVREIEAVTRLSHGKVAELIKLGTIPTFKVGARRFATADQIRAYLRDRELDAVARD